MRLRLGAVFAVPLFQIFYLGIHPSDHARGVAVRLGDLLDGLIVVSDPFAVLVELVRRGRAGGRRGFLDRWTNVLGGFRGWRRGGGIGVRRRQSLRLRCVALAQRRARADENADRGAWRRWIREGLSAREDSVDIEFDRLRQAELKVFLHAVIGQCRRREFVPFLVGFLAV